MQDEIKADREVHWSSQGKALIFWFIFLNSNRLLKQEQRRSSMETRSHFLVPSACQILTYGFVKDTNFKVEKKCLLIKRIESQVRVET